MSKAECEKNVKQLNINDLINYDSNHSFCKLTWNLEALTMLHLKLSHKTPTSLFHRYHKLDKQPSHQRINPDSI